MSAAPTLPPDSSGSDSEREDDEEEEEWPAWSAEDYTAEPHVLGQGSFNCVLVNPRRPYEVVRLYADTSGRAAADTKGIERGDAIVQVMNEQARVLGPSVLRLTQPGRWMRDIPRTWHAALQFHGSNSACGDVFATREWNRVYVERVERAFGGDMDQVAALMLRPDEQAFFAFSLVWFMYVAQAMYGFQHRDLKSGNILVRANSVDSAGFQFVLLDGDTRAFAFPPQRYTPVVADLDFGSMLLKGNSIQARTDPGTREFMPPEDYVSGEILRERPRRLNPYYDWFALGLVLARMWLGRLPPRADPNTPVIAYVRYTFFNHVGGPLNSTLVYLVRLLALHYGLNDGRLPAPYDADATLARFMAETHGAFADRCRTELSAPVRELLARLLSWDPAHRTFNGRPHMLLTHMRVFRPYSIAANTGGGAPEEFRYVRAPILEATHGTADGVLRNHPRYNELL